MFSGIISAVNELLIGLSSAFRKNFYNYCELETAKDHRTLVSRDGSLLTVLEIDGITGIISDRTYYFNIIRQLNSSLGSSFTNSGHIMQFCFSYDPTKAEEQMEKMLEPTYESYRNLELDLAYMLDSKKAVLKEDAAYERNFVLLWTTTEVLSKQEAKKSRKQKVEEFKKANLPIGTASNPFIAHEMISDRHKAFVSNTLSSLNQVGVLTRILGVNEAVREIRMGIDEAYVGEFYEPVLPGDRITPQVMKQGTNFEELEILPKKLSQQICRKDAEATKHNNVIKIGDVYYSPLYISEFPQELNYFRDLFWKMIPYKMGWRIIFTIGGDGMASISLRHSISKVLSITSESNRMFNQSAQILEDMKREGATIVKLSCHMCTWAKDEERVAEQAATMARTVESWGRASVSETTGNPIAGLASASMGFTKRGIANPSAAPLEDALTMLPLARPTSMWKYGSVILKSPDGKLLPYQPMSSLQETWITLIFAGPGSGKSMFTNMTHIGLCGREGIKRIPRISVLDIGPSSKGFIQLMQNALPPDKKEYAVYSRITNTPEYAMNPFDLKVGCRFPFAIDRQYIINLLTLMMTDPTKERAEEGVTDFVALIVDKAYEYFSDSPGFQKTGTKPYLRDVEPSVDDKIAKIGMKTRTNNDIDDNPEDTTPYTTWYNVVDRLAEAGYWREAIVAQRHAVPTMHDLTTISAMDVVKDNYGNFNLPTGENIIDAFSRQMRSVVNNYKIFSTTTQFDLSNARMVALDLQQVAQSGSPQAERMTSIMYMYAMKLTSGDFFLDAGNVEELPYKENVEPAQNVDIEMYRNYHKNRISEIREDLKRLAIDEFHRTQKSPMVRDQVLVYMREGRKWGVEVILASQSIDDFDEHMLELSTSVFIMSAGNDATVDKIVQKVGVNDEEEISMLRHGIRGPQRETGNVFMVRHVTKLGKVTQMQNNKMGPVEVWALSTTVDDVKLRDRFFVEVGSDIGIKLLADAFPYGTAVREIENLRKNVKNHVNGSVYDHLMYEVLNRYGSKYGIVKKKLYA